jgi:hypothetical protein
MSYLVGEKSRDPGMWMTLLEITLHWSIYEKMVCPGVWVTLRASSSRFPDVCSLK